MNDKHPGPLPASWAELTAEQRSWWRQRYPWLFGEDGRLPHKSPADLHRQHLSGEAWAKRARQSDPLRASWSAAMSSYLTK